jgi:hypothetical protein
MDGLFYRAAPHLSAGTVLSRRASVLSTRLLTCGQRTWAVSLPEQIRQAPQHWIRRTSDVPMQQLEAARILLTTGDRRLAA